jgi:hypothetical protein
MNDLLAQLQQQKTINEETVALLREMKELMSSMLATQRAHSQQIQQLTERAQQSPGA